MTTEFNQNKNRFLVKDEDLNHSPIQVLDDDDWIQYSDDDHDFELNIEKKTNNFVNETNNTYLNSNFPSQNKNENYTNTHNKKSFNEKKWNNNDYNSKDRYFQKNNLTKNNKV